MTGSMLPAVKYIAYYAYINVSINIYNNDYTFLGVMFACNPYGGIARCYFRVGHVGCFCDKDR
jgi:hypothetical protein